ncbi:MAG: hypothetical protein Q8L86_20025 [Vicinamibacterales bacterium]|nr:hypothetical protein [Vicinamibacterales bacterium]
MLRTNLSTRPFYNQRAVRAVLTAVAVAALGLTAFNATRIVTLTSAQRALAAEATMAESRARELRAESQRLRAAVDQADIQIVQMAASEANRLIDRRAFSWTALFNHFEATLPADVRIASVTPTIDTEGRLMIAVSVISRGIKDLDAFIRSLEATGAFRAVLTRQEEALPDGTLRSLVQGYYGATTAAPVPASEPGTAPPDGPVTEGGRP